MTQRSWVWRHRWWFWGIAIILSLVLVADIFWGFLG